MQHSLTVMMYEAARGPTTDTATAGQIKLYPTLLAIALHEHCSPSILDVTAPTSHEVPMHHENTLLGNP